jgi:phenylpyruvate tautomerase PptA (4-oxalocrotonate tautomerase family)
MPTVHVGWTSSRPEEAYPAVARAIAAALASVPSAGVQSTDDVLVYFDDLEVGALYVNGAPLVPRPETE